jgi:opacity protein-like surface antigen
MRRTAVFTLFLLFLVATVGSAQWRGGLREVRGWRGDQRSWGTIGLAGVGGAPTGEFRDLVDHVAGGNANLTLNLNRRGTFGLRIDGSYLQYGSEDRPLPATSTGGLLRGDMTTAFYIASLRAGPEFVGTGHLRPYIFGTAGISYFATETSAGICCGTTNYHDAVASFAGGGGLRMDITHSRRRPVSLELGVTFVRNGAVNYLREGDIVDNPDGTYSFNPVRSETNLFLLHAGLTFGL